MRVKIRTDVKVGIIAIAVVAILIWGINFLKGRDVFRTQNNYYAVYHELDGLLPSSSVYINGLKLGRVKKIEYGDPSLNRFILRFQINSDIKLPRNSSVRVFSSDILGSKALEIVIGDDASSFFKNGDTIPTNLESSGILGEVAKQIGPIKDKTEALLSDLDTIVSSIKSVLNKQTQEELIQTLHHINTMSSNLSSASIKLDGLLDSEKEKVSAILSNTESITLNFKQNNDKLSNIINNFSDISDTIVKANISKTLQDANNTLSSLSSIVQKIEKGKGNVGMLVNNDSLYVNLERSMKNLDLLIEDIRKNPKRYVRISIF